MESERPATRLVRALGRAIRLRCPRCGATPLFRGWFRMAEACALCGLRFERAQGYFVGAIYVNYAAAVILAIGGFFLLGAGFGFPPAAQAAVVVPIVGGFPLGVLSY